MTVSPGVGPRAAGTLNGLPVGPGRVLASTSRVEVEFVVAGDYVTVSFTRPLAAAAVRT